VTRYGRIEPIAPDHDTRLFDCGSEEQTNWLRQHALQAHQSDTAKAYVVCLAGTRTVVGYYALAAASIEHAEAPSRLTKGTGRYPVPVVILTRLGVDLGEQGRGLGSALVRDAFLQVAAIAEVIGVRGLLIHAETEAAAEFYYRIDPGFERSPTDPLHVLLLTKDLRRAIRDAAVGTEATELATALHESDPDARNVTERLDAISGAFERAGKAEAAAGAGTPAEAL
jgi:GNAT superfamily N-acetyltransferase